MFDCRCADDIYDCVQAATSAMAKAKTQSPVSAAAPGFPSAKQKVSSVHGTLTSSYILTVSSFVSFTNYTSNCSIGEESYDLLTSCNTVRIHCVMLVLVWTSFKI